MVKLVGILSRKCVKNNNHSVGNLKSCTSLFRDPMCWPSYNFQVIRQKAALQYDSLPSIKIRRTNYASSFDEFLVIDILHEAC